MRQGRGKCRIYVCRVKLNEGPPGLVWHLREMGLVDIQFSLVLRISFGFRGWCEVPLFVFCLIAA